MFLLFCGVCVWVVIVVMFQYFIVDMYMILCILLCVLLSAAYGIINDDRQLGSICKIYMYMCFCRVKNFHFQQLATLIVQLFPDEMKVVVFSCNMVSLQNLCVP